ncbi:MAG: TrkH family potassium uptake protein [Thermoplasmata archaeon]
MFSFEKTELDLTSAITLAALVWLVISVIGALPFWIARGFFGTEWGLNFLSAIFESMSGFTATGLTMYGMRVEGLPWSILFWRSLTQWVGGVGVIVLFLSVLVTRTGTVAHRLYTAEGRDHRLVPSVVRTTRRIWLIYFGYTMLCILVLFLVGMPLFDSVNHSMTGLATGGFSVRNESIMYYDSTIIEMAIIPFMILGGISFAMHHELILGRIKVFFKNIEVKAMLTILFVSALLLVLNQGIGWENVRYSSFQVTTALTGTGFNTAVVGQWNDFSKFILTILMVFGGGFGSTASALKLFRVVVIFWSLGWLVKRMLLPESARFQLKIGDKYYHQEDIMKVAIYAVLYILVLVAGALVFMAGGATTIDSMFEVSSALGNVGLSVGTTSSSMPWWEKIVLIVEMWAGRLEIFPVLVLLTSPFRAH